MSSEENKTLIAEIFRQKTETGTNGPLLAAMEPDAVWTQTGSSRFSRDYQGPEDFRKNCLELVTKQLAGGNKSHLRDIRAVEDQVIVQWKGESQTHAGTRYDNEYCWIFTMNEGRITRVVAYLDTLLLEKVMDESAS